MSLNFNIINCLAQEYLVTVQIKSGDQVLHIKTVKGQGDDGMDIHSVQISATPKHALMSHKFNVSHIPNGLDILLAWPKERKYTEWKFAPKESPTDNISSCYYISKEGIFHQQCSNAESKFEVKPSKLVDWKKVKKIEEIRGASGKVMEIICTPHEN